MTEKVLQFDANVVPQEQYWDCGPASAQVVLNASGVIASESALTAQIGTNVNGTDDISWVLRALRPALPDAGYVVTYLPDDPPTAVQKAHLWADIVRSVDSGYGVVMNWEAPPSNYPVGVKGSQSPSYSGGTVFHYVACMGYDVENSAVYIADPGFRPFEYWISFDQCASLIPPKGYAAAHPAAAPITDADRAQILSGVMGGRLSAPRYQQLLPDYSAQLSDCDCATVDRIAMNAAQLGEESGGLYYTEEIASGAEYEGRADLGNTQPGDGVRFKGRSWIQITGRDNYTRLSQWAFSKGLVPTATFFVDNPAELASDQYAGLGAAWYWVVARPDINALADAHDIVAVTQRINGGQNGIDDRTARYNNALSMGDQLLQLISPTTEGDGILMALSDDEQHEVLDGIRWLREQFDVSRPDWDADADLGTDSQGRPNNLRTAVAGTRRDVTEVKQKLADPKAAVVSVLSVNDLTQKAGS
jgi:predicted chitinase